MVSISAQRCIAQGLDDARGRLESGGQQRVALHAITFDDHDAGKAAEGDRCGHRERRQQRDRPQHGHQNHSATRIPACHCAGLSDSGVPICADDAADMQRTALLRPQAAGASARTAKAASPSRSRAACAVTQDQAHVARQHPFSGPAGVPRERAVRRDAAEHERRCRACPRSARPDPAA